MLVSYDSAAIDRIEIISGGSTTTLQKEGNIWMMTEPMRAAAESKLVQDAIGKGRSLRVHGLVSSNPQKQAMFQVDSTATLIRICEKENVRAAFRLGKPGTTYTETYVRREGDNDVYLIDGMIVPTFARQPRDWRDKAILSLTPGKIHTVQFHYGRDTTFTLALHDSIWRVDGEPATDNAVREFLASLAAFQSDDFVDTTLSTLPPLAAMLDVDGTQIGFHRAPGANMYTVITSRSTQVYTVYSWRADQVLKRKNNFTAQQ
jgi:hypothetical protein